MGYVRRRGTCLAHCFAAEHAVQPDGPQGSGACSAINMRNTIEKDDVKLADDLKEKVSSCVKENHCV